MPRARSASRPSSDPQARRARKIRRLAHAEDAVRVVIYLAIATSGAAVLIRPPRTYNQVDVVLTTGWGLLQLLALVGALAIVAGRPLLEWRIVTPVACGILLYAILSFQAVGREGLGHLPRATVITALSLYPIARFFGIWQRIELAKQSAAITEQAKETAALTERYRGEGDG